MLTKNVFAFILKSIYIKGQVMELNFNIGSLKIVQIPLLEYFKNVSENLEATKLAIKNNVMPLEINEIETIIKIQKTLNMIGLTSFVKILKSTEEALLKIKFSKADKENAEKILEVIQSVVHKGAVYIKLLTNGIENQSVEFFEDYKVINDFLGKKVSIKNLFVPKLEFNNFFPSNIEQELKLGLVINGENKQQILERLNKINAAIINESANIKKIIQEVDMHGKELAVSQCKESIRRYILVLEQIQELKVSKHTYMYAGLQHFYLSALLLNDTLFNQAVFASKSEGAKIFTTFQMSIDEVCNNVSLLGENEKTGSFKVNEQAINDLAFDVVEVLIKFPALKDSQEYRALSQYFDFIECQKQLNNISPGLMDGIISQEDAQKVNSIFSEIKDSINLLDSKNLNSQDEFFNLVKKIINLSNELTNSLTKPSSLHRLFNSISESLSFVRTSGILSIELTQEISLALILCEHCIEHITKNNYVDSKFEERFTIQAGLQAKRIKFAQEGNMVNLNSLPLPSLDFIFKGIGEQNVLSKIFTEISQGLQIIEDQLEGFFRDESIVGECLPQVIKELRDIRGVLITLGKPLLVKLVEQNIETWELILDQGKINVGQDTIKNCVNFISGLSLYADAFRNENNVEAENIYESIVKKFYPISGEVETSQDIFMENTVTDTDTDMTEVEQALEIDAPEFISEHKLEDSLALTKSQDSPVEVNARSKTAFYTQSPEDEELAEVFLIEASDVLVALTESLGVLKEDINNAEALLDVRRYFHTLKGSGRMIGLTFLGEAAWMVEQTLNNCTKGGERFSNEILSEIYWIKGEFFDWIQSLKDIGEATIDLVTIKNRFSTVNPTLTSSIEIECNENNSIKSIQKTHQIDFDSVEAEDIKIIEDFGDLNYGMPTESLANNIPNIEKSEMDNEQAVAPNETVLASNKIVDNKSDLEHLSEMLQSEIVSIKNHKVEEHTKINGQDVSVSLLRLFNEEGREHIGFLKKFIFENFYNNTILTDDFMRHAHTLASISKTVNMQQIAEMSTMLENISNASLGQNKGLRVDELLHIKEVVDFIENLMCADREINYENFESLINQMQKIQLRMIEIEDVVDEEIFGIMDATKKEETQVAINEHVQENRTVAGATITEDVEKITIHNLIKNVINPILDKVQRDVSHDVEHMCNKIYKNIGEETKENNKNLIEQIESLLSKKSNETNVESRLDNLSSDIEANQKATIKVLNEQIELQNNVIKGLTEKLNEISDGLKCSMETIEKMQEQASIGFESNKKYHGIMFNLIKREMGAIKSSGKSDGSSGLFGFLKK